MPRFDLARPTATILQEQARAERWAFAWRVFAMVSTALGLSWLIALAASGVLA